MTLERAAPQARGVRRLGALVLGFAARQLSAAAFGALLLALIVVSRLFWPADALAPRYDALLIAAIGLQAALILGGWESWAEARLILLFHLAGTVMEIFKTAAGSWAYPEPAYIALGGVPLFTGFMYAAVGSYLARAWRLFDLRFEGAPPFWAAAALAAAAYVNFFAHHFVWDARLILFAAAGWLFWRTWAQVRIVGPGAETELRAPFLALMLGAATLIWAAENIATWAHVWLYPHQEAGWRPVALAKIGSWFLLALLSFVLVAAARRGDPALTEAGGALGRGQGA